MVYTDNQTFTNRWNFETDAVIADITLYAYWVKTYNVTFNSNGGSKVPAQTVKVCGKASEPYPAPIREIGYVFLGWYTDNQTFTNRWDFEENNIVADTILFAKWEAIEHELDKRLFRRWNGDPAMPYTSYEPNFREYLWDKNLTTFWTSNDPMITESNGVLPPKGLTFDLGKIYTLTYFKIWHRSGFFEPQNGYWAFAWHNPKTIRIYGAVEPNVRKAYDHSDDPAHQNQKWIFLGEFDTVKPSGLPL